jgi:hypothetical protein
LRQINRRSKRLIRALLREAAGRQAQRRCCCVAVRFGADFYGLVWEFTDWLFFLVGLVNWLFVPQNMVWISCLGNMSPTQLLLLHSSWPLLVPRLHKGDFPPHWKTGGFKPLFMLLAVFRSSVEKCLFIFFQSDYLLYAIVLWMFFIYSR